MIENFTGLNLSSSSSIRYIGLGSGNPNDSDGKHIDTEGKRATVFAAIRKMKDEFKK
jgi:hypothetical protein